MSWRSALSYDATVALIAALQRNPTRSGVQQALASSDFSATGASSTIRFLASGEPPSWRSYANAMRQSNL